MWTPSPKMQRVDDIVRRVEALPGVQSAFASNFIPLGGGGGGGRAIVEGEPYPRTARSPASDSPGSRRTCFRTLGLALVNGRDLTDAEGMTRDARCGDQRDDGEETLA